jgi:NAD-dependent deacetylase
MPPNELDLAGRHAQNCDLMLVLGSSLTVNPAASLVGLAIEAGARVVLINQGETPYDEFVSLRIRAGIGNILPAAVQQAKGSKG